MDIPNPPEHIRKAYRRSIRRSILEGDEFGVLAAASAKQEFEDIKRFAFAIEQLIDHQESAEIEALTAEVNTLDEKDRGEFLAWHHPFHWDQVVRVLFRASIVTTIVSFLETTLVQVCKDVRLVTEERLKSSDLQGGAIVKRKKYLIRFGGFSTMISSNVWKDVEDIVVIRNALVHANGKIDSCRSPKKVRILIDQCPGLAENMDIISIEKEYIEHCVKCVGELLSYLFSEMRSLCKQRKQFELK